MNMARMKTFFLYFIGIVGFIFFSFLMEDALIANMYYEMVGEVVSSPTIIIDNYEGKSTNVNGYMQFRLSNTSQEMCDDFVKIELYSKQGLLAITEYVKITDLEPGKAKTYNVTLDGEELRKYKLSIVDEAPDTSNIINIFGWEIDLTNAFGLGIDLTNVSIFGVKIKDVFTWNNLKTAGGNAWNFATNFVEAIPLWGYVIGAGIVLHHMPAGFLFGFFPL